MCQECVTETFGEPSFPPWSALIWGEKKGRQHLHRKVLEMRDNFIPFHFTRDPTRLEWLPARVFSIQTDTTLFAVLIFYYYYFIAFCITASFLVFYGVFTGYEIIHRWAHFHRWLVMLLSLSTVKPHYTDSQALISHILLTSIRHLYTEYTTLFFKFRSDLNLGATDFKQGLTILL